jgi:hypothetical protein
MLKTKGYHLEHNFGYGRRLLLAFLLSLNLLAFLLHTVLEWDVQVLMRYMVFDSWHYLMDFMIRGLEFESQFDTS